MEKVLEMNKAFYERYSELDNSEEFWNLMVAPMKQSIRINTLKAPLDYIKERLEERYELEPIPWVKEGFFINTREFGDMIEYSLGLVFPQEASSMIPPVVLDPQPGELVLDMAAAPGAKTTQIAQYMENKGCIIANDMKKWRVNVLIANLNRFGVLNTRVTVKDGTYFGRFENTFDKILLDAPCSSVGMVRKSFKFLFSWSMKKVITYSNIQKKLIMAAYKALKPRGVLVYSTCTIDPLENEGVVDYLLLKTDAKIEKIDLPLHSTPPVLEFDGMKYSEEVRKCLRIHPQDNNTEAFFVAKIRKP
ncbi:MAG TPA: NOL1/NOP2/sun family putative RNA methylase [Thermococcaceae archaeon]|uniref:Putative nucleolar protein I n=2 Tax=Thermococcus sibiricus TaxID=172049 RepID=C6A4R0_THESM|nr:tRNA (cytosine(49)-C(5))-methyltransferase [Thermococcus sibiricus]ACS90605.1 Putative nucleolar protein I [Thermococcus sibiricus MM 739]KUK17222.1 MAG: Putative nucleolar protein I [Thermococcus sibiricus]KUK28172.1 MAG: Putative nucleolar protein I [Thermococcus sp. 40_45]HII67667.1 NOL1/NOP2/sun family putative RNA methylase [Thermococcaceae archaeon]